MNLSVFAQVDVVEKNLEIVLGIDKIEKLIFAPSTQVQVGNGSIVKVTMIPQKREITFTGIKPGKTSVTIRNTVGDIKAKYLVTITANDQSRIVRELRDFIGHVEGIEIGVKGQTVYVGGEIIVPNDIGLVAKVLNQDKFGEVLYLVELSQQTERLVARKMQSEIQKSQLRDVTVRVVNGAYWLEGIVGSNGDKARAAAIAAAFYPDKIASLAERTDQIIQVKKQAIQNFIQVNKKQKPQPVPKMIKVTAQFVELSKDYSRVFGFKWTPLLANNSGSINIGRTNSGNVNTNSSNTLSATISNLFPKLDSAKQAGYARIIQSGVIVVKDKIQGTITKSEDRRFSIGSNEFTQGQSAKAAFTVRVTPTVLQEEKVDLNLGIDVSTNIGQDPPTTQSNTINTQIIVKSRESAVVGGIVVNKTSTDYDKVPSDTTEGASPLFNFVRSKSLINTKSQFVVFVTPEIIDSATSGTSEIRKKFRKRRR
jgi:pilus assembly protein CpaC